MKVDGKHLRSIWLEPNGCSVAAIDQRRLPHDFVVAQLATCDAAADAIRSMLVRGAPLIGATAAYGIALAMRADGSDAALDQACELLMATRPTAINLKWALDEMRALLRRLPPSERTVAAYARAAEIAIAFRRDGDEHVDRRAPLERAQHPDGSWLIRQNALRLLAGILAAVAASRWIASMLFGLTATDPSTIFVAAAVLLAAGLIAAYPPARHASRIDPMSSLRCE